MGGHFRDAVLSAISNARGRDSAALSVGVTADAGVRDRRVAVPALLGNTARACGDPRAGLGAQGARGAGAVRGSAGAGSRAARR